VWQLLAHPLLLVPTDIPRRPLRRNPYAAPPYIVPARPASTPPGSPSTQPALRRPSRLYVDPAVREVAATTAISPAFAATIAAGLSTDFSALTPGTVRNYLSSAAAKLGAANRHEAVQLARSRGWI
jgi:hypothetical protein